MFKTFGGKMIEAGVVDSLQSLKRAAEARYRSSVVEQS
jgi:hypothetical protein